MRALETQLRALRDSGRKALVPYLVAGSTDQWVRHVEAAVLGGADAIEIGIPFSDPMMDGPVIQAAAQIALERSTTFESVCGELETLDVDVPLIAMTYYNVFLHHGLERAAGRLRAAGVLGAILPDLAMEESNPWRESAGAVDLATILLVAPSTPADRAHRLAQASEGFTYAAARMAVTGVARDDGDAARVVATIREASDIPVYVGIGVSRPVQAQELSKVSDGVIVGSALVERIIGGSNVADTESFVRSFRDALDE